MSANWLSQSYVAAQEALLLAESVATAFKGPHEVRVEGRKKDSPSDKHFVGEMLDRLRSGG